MSFLSFWKGMYRKLFPIKDIKSALNIKTAVSQEMLERIECWQNCYSGKADWLNENVISLRLEQSIVREFSNVVTSEMSANVNNSKLNKIFQAAVRDLNMHLQSGLATGGMVIKPLGAGNKVQYVAANAYIPVEFDSRGRLLKVIFPEFKKLNDRYYTRLEYHSLDEEKGLNITNTAYLSNSAGTLGRQIALQNVEEWAKLEENISYPMMKRPAFGYYRNPLNNNIDASHCGISVFDSALDLIRLADTQFGRLDWEFDSGERLVLVDEAAIKPNKNKKSFLPKLKERLFRGIDLEGGANGDSFYKEFSPQLRQADIIAGLEEYKRNIEFAVGLAYGDLSNPQMVNKTATEVKAAKDRKYNTVKAIQKNLKDCLDDLVYSLAFYNAMTTSGYKFTCDFKDSILTDDETERTQDRQDLANGTLRPEEYRAKWRNENIDTALANLPKTAEVND